MKVLGSVSTELTTGAPGTPIEQVSGSGLGPRQGPTHLAGVPPGGHVSSLPKIIAPGVSVLCHL